MYTDEQIEQMAKVLRAIVDIPIADRMNLLGAALNVAIQEGMLTREVDLKALLRQRWPSPIPPLPVPGPGRQS